MSPVFLPAAAISACAGPRWWLKKMGHEQPLRHRNLVVGGEAQPGHPAGERSGGNRTRRAQNPQDVEQTIGAAQGIAKPPDKTLSVEPTYTPRR
jgi:hypothetical protein